MGKNCTCKISNLESLSCPEYGLDVQIAKKASNTIVLIERYDWDEDTQYSYGKIVGYANSHSDADLFITETLKENPPVEVYSAEIGESVGKYPHFKKYDCQNVSLKM